MLWGLGSSLSESSFSLLPRWMDNILSAVLTLYGTLMANIGCLGKNFTCTSISDASLLKSVTTLIPVKISGTDIKNRSAEQYVHVWLPSPLSTQ